MTYFKTEYPSPVGMLTLASDGQALCGIWFENQAHFGKGAPQPWQEADVPVLRKTKHWLDRYFAGEEPGFLPPLKPQGTPFQKAVWEHLLGIPYGQTVTYGQIAQALDCPSSQAVGGAAGRNPISILIPCHRVVGSGGRLTGYAGGLQRKQALLTLEGTTVLV